MTLAAPATLDLAIIGAGPHALTLATHLLQKLMVQAGRLPFHLSTASGTIRARRVIIATGAGKPKWPDWAVRTQLEYLLQGHSPSVSLAHSSQVDLRQTPIVKGLPVLDQHLRWPNLELFLTGGLAALQLGPVARNLHGARMAAERIVPAIAKPSLALGQTSLSR